MQSQVIDSHAHCGNQDKSAAQDFMDYRALIQGTSIEQVVMFAPVQEIYDRFDPYFQDNEYWRNRRRQANAYILGLKGQRPEVIPFFFVWNDFDLHALDPAFQGIKWHRHADEPIYNYQDPACKEFLQEVARRNLPVVLEEELQHTVFFIRELAPEVRVIIPHLGALNGGFSSLAREGIWELERVYTDTSLAGAGEIRSYMQSYGTKRILFGSDFPFGHPARELQKIQGLGLDQSTLQAVCRENIQSLLAENRA
ncbi:MAG: amidohydrolase family protein [Thermodesulfobacteriota bacterium]